MNYRKKTTFIDKLIFIPAYIKLLKKYNTLEGEYEVLKTSVEEKLLEKYMKELNIPIETQRLREENDMLREKIKKYKEKY